MKRKGKVKVEKLNKVKVERVAKVDLYISDYAKNTQKMTKQELAKVYGTIMSDIHSGQYRKHKKVEMKKER